MPVSAFLDNGYEPGHDFCRMFLSSPEFKLEFLKQLIPDDYEIQKIVKNHKNKEDLAASIPGLIETGHIPIERILSKYVCQPRYWLTFMTGNYHDFPELGTPKSLFTEFCADGWHGPVLGDNPTSKWYIRTKSVPYFSHVRSDGETTVQINRVRWTVAAEICSDFIALSWNGFSYRPEVDDHLGSSVQFPFWKEIPSFTEELINHIGGSYEMPNLHKLVLFHLWDKYLTDVHNSSFSWQHLRIRAEAAGVALNAHSSGISDINVKGIQALSSQLAKASIEALGVVDFEEKLPIVEKSILRTLIHEWGAKSYEFSLDSNEQESDDQEGKRTKKIFRSHCYFGLKSDNTSQDSLQHMRCYSHYGAAKGALDFLLKELREMESN
jgi:hypothetical protein